MAHVDIGLVDSELLQFVVDIMEHLMRKHHPNLLHEFVKTDVAMTVEGCRSGVKDYFTGNISKIVDKIDMAQTIQVDTDFSEIKAKNPSSLEAYISKLKLNTLTEGFDAECFLNFCVRVCLMSLRFMENATKDALEISLKHIQNSFPKNKDEGILIWKGMCNIAKKYKNESVAREFYRSEKSDDVSSGTDESSNSSTTNTESDTASESRNATSASSAESLNELIMRLNASTVKPANNAETKGKVTSAVSIQSGSIVVNEASSAGSTTICTITIDSSETVIAAASGSTEDDEGKENSPTSCSEGGNVDEESKPTQSSATSTTTSCKDKKSSVDFGNVEGAVQSPSVSSSAFTMPKCDVDFGPKFATMLGTSEVTSPERTPVKSPSKSFLGKRSSPRSGISLRGTANESETEIKKLKLESTEKNDKDE